MNIALLDYYFPFFVFCYGALVYFVLNFPPLVKIAEQRLPIQYWQQLKMHRALSLFSLILGGLWSLQNIWFVKLF